MILPVNECALILVTCRSFPAELLGTVDGSDGTAKPWRMFLSLGPCPRRLGSRLSAAGTRASCPHGLDASPLLATVSPLTSLREATLGKLSSPSDRTRRARSRRRVARPLRRGLIGLGDPGDPGTAWDSHRSVRSAVVNRRDHLTPRGSQEIAVTLSCEASSSWKTPGASARLGAWHTTRGRTVAPPALSLPGPSVIARCRTTLAAYLFR